MIFSYFTHKVSRNNKDGYISEIKTVLGNHYSPAFKTEKEANDYAKKYVSKNF